ncbi:MAG: hypothetical protein EA424_17880, partial [Planctomycetaceae bacterium]
MAADRRIGVSCGRHRLRGTAGDSARAGTDRAGLLHDGLTIELAFRLEQMQPGRVLLECRSDSGRGWTTDTGMLDAGRRHQVTRIIDGGPNLI